MRKTTTRQTWGSAPRPADGSGSPSGPLVCKEEAGRLCAARGSLGASPARHHARLGNRPQNAHSPALAQTLKVKITKHATRESAFPAEAEAEARSSFRHDDAFTAGLKRGRTLESPGSS